MSRLARAADLLHAVALRAPGARPRRGLLLTSCGGLGDTILFAHVADRFAALAQDGEPVSILLRADGAATAFCLPPGIEVLTVDFTRLRGDFGYRLATFRALAGRAFRCVISTDFLRHPHLDEALILATGAPELWAMEARPWPKYAGALAANARRLTRIEPAGPVHKDKILRWADFADRLAGATRPPPVARLPESRLPAAETVERPTVVVQPFSAVAAKQLRPDDWHRLLAAVPDDHAVVVTGGPKDLERHPAFRSLLEDPRARFDSRRFADILPLLRAARLIVSVDTAMMHLAAAVGTPTLGLASAAYVGEIVPYAPAVTPPNLKVMHADVDCAGCLGDCSKPLVGGLYDCLSRLDIPAAAAEIARRLA